MWRGFGNRVMGSKRFIDFALRFLHIPVLIYQGCFLFRYYSKSLVFILGINVLTLYLGPILDQGYMLPLPEFFSLATILPRLRPNCLLLILSNPVQKTPSSKLCWSRFILFVPQDFTFGECRLNKLTLFNLCSIKRANCFSFVNINFECLMC